MYLLRKLNSFSESSVILYRFYPFSWLTRCDMLEPMTVCVHACVGVNILINLYKNYYCIVLFYCAINMIFRFLCSQSLISCPYVQPISAISVIRCINMWCMLFNCDADLELVVVWCVKTFFFLHTVLSLLLLLLLFNCYIINIVIYNYFHLYLDLLTQLHPIYVSAMFMDKEKCAQLCCSLFLWILSFTLTFDLHLNNDLVKICESYHGAKFD
jgi:hypothetical protein